MSVYQKRQDDRSSGRNSLVVVNPREDVIKSFSERVVDAAISYEGDVYRVDNLDRIDDIAGFYDSQEDLAEGLGYFEHEDLDFWRDEFFVFDEEGLDRIDCNNMLEDTSTFEFIGGPLHDIGIVKNSIDRETSMPVDHVLNRHLAADYGGFNSEQGYVTSDFMSLNEVIDYAPETLQQRLEIADLDSDNVNF